jgi:hypothetical protein
VTQQAPLEERTYVQALGRMLAHVADCEGCRTAACSRCSLVGVEHADADECIAAAEKAKQTPAPVREGGGVLILPRADERDLSDPRSKLCPRGDELRAACRAAMAELPAERLVRYWGLESPDVPPDDRWDATRGAEWLRSDPAQARLIVGQLEARRGQRLEEVDVPTEHLRDGFLKGFRSTHPGPGRPPTEEELAARRAAVERIVALISDRFVHRFRGILPHPAAVEAFRRGHDLAHDWVAFAAGVEAVQLRKATVWGQPAPRGTEPGDVAAQADELRKLAKWAAERFAEMESEKG